MMTQSHKQSKNQYPILNSKERSVARLRLLQKFSQYKPDNELYKTDDSYNVLTNEYLLTNPNNIIYQKHKHSKEMAVARLRLLQKFSQYKMDNKLDEMVDSYNVLTKEIPVINSNDDNELYGLTKEIPVINSNDDNELYGLTKEIPVINSNDDNELYGLMKIDTFLTKENPVKIIIPNYDDNNIHRCINNNANCDKTVVCVLSHKYSLGFGDYLRGCISIAHYAKYFGVNFKMSMNYHCIYNYFNNNEEDVSYLNNIKHIHGHHAYSQIYEIFTQFMKSNEKILYISTNLIYSMKITTQDIKNTINSFLIFKPKYYELAEQLFNLEKYNVIHVRCGDEFFDKELDTITIFKLFKQIINLQLSNNTIILSNNYSLKKIINETFGYYFIDTKSTHTAKVTHLNNLDSTIIEYIILSKSSHNYCFTFYKHGSGFSEHCSVLNNVPYQVTFVSM
jgi:hypothetical protein